MHPYVAEDFTPAEREVLSRYFSNVDGPVFALQNLPEVVKGALFARYSRSSKSLRRLFLDEFAGDVGALGTEGARGSSGAHSRAAALYDKVFSEFGDDSVAQLGGAHLACEQSSNLLTKILERGRLASYLEQSTRYIPYDAPMADGRFRYYRDPQVISALGPRYEADMDAAFSAYASVFAAVAEHLERVEVAPDGVAQPAWRRALRARALDAARGLLPAATLSNVGIFASGQAFESLLLRMRVDPLPEAREYAQLMLAELRKVIPSFVSRVDRPDRGGAWSEYLRATRARSEEVARATVRRAGGERKEAAAEPGPGVRLVGFDPAGETKILTGILFERGGVSEARAHEIALGLSASERAELFEAYVGERANRRHRPGRAFERTYYRFEIVSDYGAFRDLQRHRMLTIEWQSLSPAFGYATAEDVCDAGVEGRYREAMERSGELYSAIGGAGLAAQAPYALAMAWRIRYCIKLNVREALYLIELRSDPQGHPSYRRIAREMHRCIGEEAGHWLVSASMHFLGGEAPLHGRLEAESRHAAKVAGEAGSLSEQTWWRAGAWGIGSAPD